MNKIIFLFLCFFIGCKETKTGEDLKVDNIQDYQEMDEEIQESSMDYQDISYEEPDNIIEIFTEDEVGFELELSDTIEEFAILKGPYLQNVTINSIIIAWESDKKLENPAVIYWINGQEKKEAKGISEKMDTSGFLPELPPPDAWENYVLIDNLKSSTLYYYEIKNSESEKNTFKTSPEDFKTEIQFSVVGDTKSGHEAHQNIINAMITKNSDFYINTGDLVSSGMGLEFWDKFFEIEKPLMKNSTLFPTFGNHENGGQCYFLGYFHLPGGQPDFPTSYSFQYGNIYFIILDTQLLLTVDPWYSWIEAELQKAQSGKYPYIFISMHAPIYTFSNHDPYKAGKEVLHPLFKKYGVNAVFAGHNHCYEHFMVEGIHYITTGGGGASLYDIDENVIEEEKQKYWVNAGKINHFLHIEVNFVMANVSTIKVEGEQTELFENFNISPNKY